MTNCLGCQKMENEQQCVTLHDGRVVCSSCYDWLIECEAKGLLALPLNARRQALAAREKQRGDIEQLKAVMTSICKKRKNQ